MSLIDTIGPLVQEAGDLALSFSGTSDITEKGVGDLLTAADTAVEAFLRQRLRELFPKDGFIGEESGSDSGTSGRVWIVDPIDGTADFANRLFGWSISLALAEDGQIKAGFVNAPALGKCYRAERGQGAFCNGTPLRLSQRKFDAGSFFAINASAHLGIEHTLALRLCNAPSALAPCLVAEGLALGSVTQPAYIWDIAAAYCIASETGAQFSYLSGEPFALEPLFARQRMADFLLAGSAEFIAYARERITRRPAKLI